MFNSTPVYGQLFTLLRQYSRAKDLRHFKTLAWMVSALIYSGQRASACLGTVCAKGERKKRKAWSVGNATVFGQWAGAGQPDVCAAKDFGQCNSLR